ncbi:MAG: PBP1A family penicillin-binding protein [Candidatus Beckwithbacteria bacterium]|nr:PBP1A family penicillin-binding protein [Patescibacteria group bacterium]
MSNRNFFYPLEIIGRFTYRSIFLFLKILFNFSFQLTKVLKSIKPLKLPSLPKINLQKPSINLRGEYPSLKKIFKRLYPANAGQKLTLVILIIFFSSFYWFILKDLPKPTDLTNREPTLSTKIYDRNEQLLFTFYKDQNRSLISLNEVPDHFIKATLAIEDSQFYNHNGISLKGILRSIDQIIFSQQLQGGSTITQQLIKNALLTQERTITRKIKELILSIEVELLFSKDEILEMYLNEVSYGGTAYGVEQASQTYFGKSVKDLNLAESALLAGLPASPTTYSPFGLNPHLSIYRQHQVLNRMVEEKLIAPLKAELAKQQIIKLAPQFTNIKAPHFVMFVKDILVKEYGQALVEQGGLTVITSLDFKLQETVQQIVSDEIIKVAPFNITNGAALVTNPKTGEILSMVGSRDYFDTDRDGQVNVTTRLRQPGSAIKPVNYSLALENGYTTASVIKDSPITFDIAGSKPYSPVNYDNRFHGNVTLRSALANSYNVPAVKILASLGVDKMIEQGKKLGITTWNQPERYGLSLTLGGAEIKMTDLAVVFATFANLGKKVNLHPILKVIDSKGEILMSFNCDQSINSLGVNTPKTNETLQGLPGECREQVIDSNIAYIISDILSDSYARIPAFGLSSYLNIPGHQVAVKTGTTNDKRDNWTIGYTTDYLTAVWVGNNDNSPMSQVASGITGASPIWHHIMLKILQGYEPSKFLPPTDLIKADICPITGQLSCDGCGGKTEYFVPGTEPILHCKPEYIQQLQEEKAKNDQEQRDQLLQGTSTQSQ